MPSADRPSHTVSSYSSINDTLSTKSKAYCEKYKQFVLDYAVEWENTVTNRVNKGLKTTEDLRRDLNHYQKKVEALRLATNQQLSKGKTVKPDAAEKLKRNEEKYLAARQIHHKASTDLCILIEEVVERSWRDLHPLLIKCAQFDMTLSGDEAKILAEMNAVVDKLKQAASANGISPQPRLKDLGTLKPELLSTRPGGVQQFMLEDGTTSPGTSPTASLSPSGGIFGGSNFDPMGPPSSGPPPGGMGGFPVPVSESAHMYGRSDSLSSAPPSLNYQPPSTLSMLSISQAAAPPPTMDDLYGSGAMVQSAPTSGNFSSYNYNAPPHAQPFNRADRSSSMNDADSFYSGYSAPTAASAPMPSMPPPPPPNMPPPPPPSYGMPAVDPSASYYHAPAPSGYPPSGRSDPPSGHVNPLSLYGSPPGNYQGR